MVYLQIFLENIKLFIIGMSPFYNIAILGMTAFLLIFFAASKKEGVKFFSLFISFTGILSSLVFSLVSLNGKESFSNLLFTIDMNEYRQIAVVLAIGLFILLYLSLYNLDQNTFVRIVLFYISLLICFCLFIISRDFIAIFVSFSFIVIFLFFIISSINRHIKGNQQHVSRFFIRPALSIGLVFTGFSFIYGETDLKNFQQIAESEKSGSALITIGVIMLIAAVFLFLFTPPFQNPYSKLLKRSKPGTETLIFFMYLLSGILFLNKISVFYISYIQQSKIVAYITLAVAGLFIVVGNIVAISTKSIRRITAFILYSFIGLMVMDNFLKASGFLAEIDTGILYMLSFTFLFLTFMPIITVTMELENRFKKDDIRLLRGMFYKSKYIGIAMIIFFLNLAGLIGFAGFIYRYHYITVFTRSLDILVTDTPVLLAFILLGISTLFVLANAIRIIVIIFRRDGEIIEDKKLMFYKLLYVSSTLFILIDMFIGISVLIAVFSDVNVLLPESFLNLFIS